MEPTNPWELRVANQAQLVSAYYQGQWSLRASSLRIPKSAHVRPAESGSGSELKQQKSSFVRSRRPKRKREQWSAQQTQLIATGKFIPLDPQVKAALEEAHCRLLATELSALTLVETNEEEEPTTLKCQSSSMSVLIPQRGQIMMQENDTDDVQVAAADALASCVLLPPRCSFVFGQIQQLGHVLLGRSYRLIMMDPPWINKSVMRSKGYATFHHTELLGMGIPSIAHEQQCVLGIWVTNRPQYTSFLLETLLPAWGFQYHETWYWLKVCANAELVTPLTSSHRLPFEKLIVAYRGQNDADCERLAAALGSKPKVVASVPLRHSWKPPPECFFSADDCELLSPKIEFFARELRPHWTSVGNEVLKFQSLDLFAPRSTDNASTETRQ